MTIQPTAVSGVFTNGIIIPDAPVSLTNGDRVLIVFGPTPIADSFGMEMAQWDLVSEEAWAMIDQLEKEDVNDAR